MQQVFVGLSLHRPEMIPLISEAMRRPEAIFLEEPPAPGFDQMIRGELSVDDYLLPIDAEYPAFSRTMCLLLRELHAEGKKIYQVEPFIESLLSIHESFADGHKPDDLTKSSIHFYVYHAALKSMGEKGHLYGPGDQLTLLYIFHPTISQHRWEKLLAARSMIYSKILEKQESDEEGGTFPHLRDELACIRAVRQLSIDDCRHLFPLIRRASSPEARRRVTAFLAVPERFPQKN
jgi:hypothetical protein